MARRFSRNRAIRPPARSTLWVGGRIAQTAVGASSVATLLGTLNAAALLLRPFTIVRTRLVVSVISDQTAASEFVEGAMGWQVVTETAAAAGIASLPSPLTEVDADFHVYMPFMNSIVNLTSVGAFERTGEGAFWTVDSKSMRKVGSDDDVAVTVEGASSNGFSIAIEGRFLVKLH